MLSLLPQVARLGGIALNLIFPRHCVGCGKQGDFICRSCGDMLLRIEPPICPRCGRPQSGGRYCSSCTGWQAAIDGIRSPFRFDGVMRQAIHQLKYRNLRALAAPLAWLLNDYLTEYPVPGEVLVPVPLHHKRLSERGYNQSGMLAGELGKLTGLPVMEDSLVRRRYSQPQARTSNVTERWDNIADAFICRDKRLVNKQVILIDDVSTSGATLNACAIALKEAGATTVWGLVLAREI